MRDVLLWQPSYSVDDEITKVVPFESLSIKYTVDKLKVPSSSISLVPRPIFKYADELYQAGATNQIASLLVIVSCKVKNAKSMC